MPRKAKNKVDLGEMIQPAVSNAIAMNQAYREDFTKRETATGRNGTYVVSSDSDKVAIGLPLRPFSLQWLFHNDGYALGRIHLCAGESGSCKSAFLFEAARWHLEAPYLDAFAKYHLAEARDTPVLRASIVSEEMNSRYYMRHCAVLEEWQDASTDTFKFLRKMYGDDGQTNGGPSMPMCVQTDSITGVTCQATVDTIDEDGHAKLMFALDANLINSYFKYLPSQVNRWPMSWMASCHIKTSQERVGPRMITKTRIPGGDSLKYHATTIMLFSVVRALTPEHRSDVHGGNTIRIKTLKNSLGEKGKEIEVDMVWWYVPSDPNDPDSPRKQVTVWDWDSTTVRLLKDHLNSKLYPELPDVIEFPIFFDKARQASCPKLGFRKAVPWAELGIAISQNRELMSQLQRVYGIHHVPPFRAGVPWHQQRTDALEDGHIREEKREEQRDEE